MRASELPSQFSLTGLSYVVNDCEEGLGAKLKEYDSIAMTPRGDRGSGHGGKKERLEEGN